MIDYTQIMKQNMVDKNSPSSRVLTGCGVVLGRAVALLDADGRPQGRCGGGGPSHVQRDAVQPSTRRLRGVARPNKNI